MSSTNPLLGMAIYSLANALELYRSDEPNNAERRRFGAIILMDLSVEYILKAKLYQLDQNEFMKKQQDLGFSDCINDKRIGFLEGEQSNLSTAHKARNFSQHRGAITDSLFSQEYMKWFCKFVDRFARDNFQYSVIQGLPLELKISWTKLTNDFFKGKSKPDLKHPLRENYRTVSEWIKEKSATNNRGFLRKDYLLTLDSDLKRYCNFLGMDPDQIIESTLTGTSSPTEDITNFLKTLTTGISLYSVLKSFYEFHGIKIDLPYPKYRRIESRIKEITTPQLRNLCDFSDVQERSWILANSYMGLEVGKLPLLTLKDFRTGQWENEKNIYPVKIRLEVSGYYDYTTFIGADAKNVLQQYFREKQITSENDHPWKYERAGSFQHYFKRNCKGVGIYEKGKISPKSLQKRLKNILKDSGMPHEWQYYLLGNYPYLRYTTKEFDAPIYEELCLAYEKVYPKLKVY